MRLKVLSQLCEGDVVVAIAKLLAGPTNVKTILVAVVALPTDERT